MLHRKLPSFSLTGAKGQQDAVPLSPAETSPKATASVATSQSRGRSLSPFRFKKRRDHSADGAAAEGVRKDAGHESDVEDTSPVVVPSNSFETDDEDETESELDEEDEQLERNTEANASAHTPREFLSKEEPTMLYPGEGPNLLPPSEFPTAIARPLRRRSTKTKTVVPLALVAGRPVYEKNRCTVTLTHGDPDKAAEGRRTRTYLVASDLSQESLYAIQWAIGTVLREGDECLIVSVMETDTKFDLDDGDKKAKVANQRDRQTNALMLSRQATALLEKTRLNVRIQCQAVHAKNARHMLVDMIDYLAPTMVIIGTRGLSKIQGMLLGSVSNYLIQKSSAPVMVTRRPLRLARTVHKRLSSLNRESRMPLAEAAIDKESKGGEVEDDPDESADVATEVEKLEISTK